MVTKNTKNVFDIAAFILSQKHPLPTPVSYTHLTLPTICSV